MLSWDAKAIEEEGRRQRMRDDFELSGDDESVVSDDAEEEDAVTIQGKPGGGGLRRSTTQLARERLRRSLPSSIQQQQMQTPPSSHQHHHHHHHQDEAPVATGAASSLDKALQAISRQLSKGSGFEDSEPTSQSQRGRSQADPRAGLFDDDFDSFGSQRQVQAARPHASAHRGGGGADGGRGGRHDGAFNGSTSTSQHQQPSFPSAPSSQRPRPPLSSASACAEGRAGVGNGAGKRPPAKAPQSASKLRALASQISRSFAPSTQTSTSSQSGRGGKGRAGSRQASQKEPTVPWSGDFGDDDEVEEIGDSDEEVRDGEARAGGSSRQPHRDGAGGAGSGGDGSPGRSPGAGQGSEGDEMVVDDDDVPGSVGESSDEGGSMSSARTPESKGRSKKTNGRNPSTPRVASTPSEALHTPKATVAGASLRERFGQAKSSQHTPNGGSSLRSMFAPPKLATLAASQHPPSSTKKRKSAPPPAPLPPASRLSMASSSSQPRPHQSAAGRGKSNDEDITEFSEDESAAPSQRPQPSQGGGGDGGGGGVDLQRKTSWLTRMKSNVHTLPAPAPPGPIGGSRRRRPQGRLEGFSFGVIERLEADKRRFAAVVSANGGVAPLADGEEAPLCGVITGDAYMPPNFWVYRVRISGISASAKVQECDAIFNVSLKNDNTIQGVGCNVLIYQPWTAFSIPGSERPVILAGNRVSCPPAPPASPPPPTASLLALLESGPPSSSKPPPPPRICDLPVLPRGGASDGRAGESAGDEGGKLMLIKDLSPWSCNITIKGHVMRCCARSSLLERLHFNYDGAEWMQGGPKWAQNLAKVSCYQARAAEPSLFIVDESGVVVELLVPLKYVESWSRTLVQCEGSRIVATRLAVSSVQSRGSDALSSFLAISPHVLQVTSNTDMSLAPSPMYPPAARTSLRAARPGARVTVEVHVIEVKNPDPMDRSGVCAVILAVGDASMPAGSRGVCVSVAEPFLSVSTGVNIISGDVVRISDAMVLASPSDCPDSEVKTLVIDSHAGMTLLLSSRGSCGVIMPQHPGPLSAPPPPLQAQPANLPAATPGSSFVTFQGCVREMANVRVAEACPKCPNIQVQQLPDADQVYCSACGETSEEPAMSFLPLRLTLSDSVLGSIYVEVKGEALTDLCELVCPDLERPGDLERSLLGRTVAGRGYWWWKECDEQQQQQQGMEECRICALEVGLAPSSTPRVYQANPRRWHPQADHESQNVDDSQAQSGMQTVGARR